MKRLIIGTLSLVFLSSLAVPVAQAQTQAINSEAFRTIINPVAQLTPFELVSMAVQGATSAAKPIQTKGFAAQTRWKKSLLIDSRLLVEKKVPNCDK